MWLNGLEQNRETDEEHDEDCVVEGFQLAKVKFDRNGKGGREALGMGYCSCHIWNELELKLAWSRKNISYFENNAPIFLLSSNSNTSVFKLYDVSHRVHFSVMKSFYNIFHSKFFWIWAGNVWI